MVRALLVVATLSGCTGRAASAHRAGGSDGSAPRVAGPAPAPEPSEGEEQDTGRQVSGSTVSIRAIEGEVVVKVEVVKTQEKRSRGLMFRRTMAEDAGMLFLFRAPEHQTFWMRNTYLPLDMIFIGADHRVVGVAENAAPRTDTTREVDGDSQYVLEVNAGFARRWGVGPGTLVELRGVDETGVDP